MRVPEDLELLSIDITSSELTTHSSPSLSIIKMPTDIIGAAAIDLLQEKLKTNNPEPVHMEIAPELVLRESFKLQ